MTAGNYVRNLSGGGPDNPCWPYQPAEARTAAGSRYPRALRPCPPCPGVLHAGDGGFAALEAGWRRVVGVSESRVVQFPRRIGGGAVRPHPAEVQQRPARKWAGHRENP